MGADPMRCSTGVLDDAHDDQARCGSCCVFVWGEGTGMRASLGGLGGLAVVGRALVGFGRCW